MSFNLSTMAHRADPRRTRPAILRDIRPPSTLATDLFASCYKPVIAAIEAMLPDVEAEYARTSAAMTTDSAMDFHSLFEDAGRELARLVLVLTPRLRNWALGIEKWHRREWRGAVLAATGIDLETLLGLDPVRQSVDAAIAWNVALVKDVSAQAQQRIATLVFTGLRERRPVRDVARDIRAAVDMSRRRSIGIASDQLSKLSSSLASERRREAGLDSWKWRHSGKLHPRVRHKERDGQIYSENPVKVDGGKVLPPPPDDDLPGIPPWCGCREQAIIDF